MENGIGGIVMPLGRQTGSLPDLANGVGTDTDDPTRDQNLEGAKDFDPEAVAKRF
jgi:hypothetical protein